MTFLSDASIRRLSAQQRDVLIQHVAANGRLPLVMVYRPTNVLIDMKMLRCVEGGRITELTDLGRHAAAGVLGHYADALVEAGFLERGHRPTDMLARIKAAQTAPPPATPADLAALMAEKRP